VADPGRFSFFAVSVPEKRDRAEQPKPWAAEDAGGEQLASGDRCPVENGGGSAGAADQIDGRVVAREAIVAIASEVGGG